MHSSFYHWYQCHTNIVQGSTNDAIGNTIGADGANGTDHWFPTMQTTEPLYNVLYKTNMAHSTLVIFFQSKE